MSDRTTDEEYRETDEFDETDEAYRDEAYEPNPSERGKWLSAIIAVLGLWLVVEAFLFLLGPGQFWNDVLVGLTLVVVGGYNYYRRADERLGNVAAAAIAAVLGLWLVAAPFLIGADAGLTEAATALGFWNDVVVGLLVFVLGAYSAYEIRDRRHEARARATS